MADIPAAKEMLSAGDADRAIALTGRGRFQLRIALVCGGCFMAAAFQSGLNSFVLPAAHCDLRMTSEQMGNLNVLFMLGTIVSSFMWGAIADMWGRKKVLLVTFLLDAACTVASSLSQSYMVFLTFRFLNGFIIGAPCSLIIPYLGEFFTNKQGTMSSCAAGFFWTLGWMVLPGFAWLIIPIEWSININGFVYNSWRIFVCVLSIPCLLAALTLCFHSESPRYLLSKGKLEEAMVVLREMYSNNTSKPPCDYPVVFYHLPVTVENETLKNAVHSKEEEAKGPKAVSTFANVLWKQVVTLFTPPILGNALLGSALLFTNMFGFYGLGLWLPELFNRFQSFYQQHPNESAVSVCELNDLTTEAPLFGALMANATTELAPESECNSAPIDPTVFVNTLIIGAVCLIGNVLSGLLSGTFRRWVMPVTTMMIAGFSGLSIYFVNNSTGILVVTCIFQAAISSANFVISGNLVEVFPTSIRALALCTCMLAGRLGSITSNVLIGELIDVYCDIPILLVGGTVVFGGLLAIFTPNANEPEPQEEGAV